MDSFWQIIPKITSPLAALCFGLYIFYLLKRSDDRKQEASLKTDDKEVQLQAVKMVLKNVPDVDIAQITDPAASLELAKKMIDDKLTRYNKTINALLIFSCIFAVSFLLPLIIGKGSGADLSVKIEKVNSLTWADSACIKNRKPYSIYCVLLHIFLHDDSVGNGKVRRALFRTTYTMHALRRINKDEDIFEEQYITSVPSFQILPWPGTDKQEIESINDGRYWVRFERNKDEVFSVMTGANYIYPFPLPKIGGSSCFENMKLEDDEWMCCYPNTADFIDEMTIIVESDNMELDRPAVSSYKKDKIGRTLTGDAACNVYQGNMHCSLVSKWRQLFPGECVAMKIKWAQLHQ